MDTPRGPALAHHLSAHGSARALAVLLHGAGSGVRGGALDQLGGLLSALGIAVVGFEQPYRVAGRRAPDRAAVLDATVLAALPQLRTIAGTDAPLLLVGRSSGARVACRIGAQCGVLAVAALGFPFAPPRGGADRGAELREAGRHHPVLVVQGQRDPFGMPPPMPGVTVRVVAGGHSPTEAGAQVAARWLADIVGESDPAARRWHQRTHRVEGGRG